MSRQLKAGKYYDLNYDNQIIVHERYDAKRTYKKNTGYSPGIATVGAKIVYVENRDGNANVNLDQVGILNWAYGFLGEGKGVKVNRSRMDAGSYAEEIVKVVDKNSRLFYIRDNR